MTRPTPRTPSGELLLARISAAAGRAHLGKRRATYAAAAHSPRAHAGPGRVIRGLLAFARYGRSSAATRVEARLDMYEEGMTVAVKGGIHVVRFDTTSVFRKSIRPPHDASRVGGTRAYTLTDVEGKQFVLYGGLQGSGVEEWGPEIQRAVTRAQLPLALAALDQGERLAFGDVWLTREEVGSEEVSARWAQVQQIEIEHGAIRLNIDGRWHTLAPTASTIRNAFVLRTLVERLRANDGGPMGDSG